MITEDYVSFETAKLLKEKGFDESCERIYDGGGYLLVNNCGYINEESPDEHFHALAPTLQMAMKWLREIHHFHIVFDITDCSQLNPKYYFVVWDTSTQNSYIVDLFDSYEQAAEAAIKYCLENLV